MKTKHEVENNMMHSDLFEKWLTRKGIKVINSNIYGIRFHRKTEFCPLVRWGIYIYSEIIVDQAKSNTVNINIIDSIISSINNSYSNNSRSRITVTTTTINNINNIRKKGVLSKTYALDTPAEKPLNEMDS